MQKELRMFWGIFVGMLAVWLLRGSFFIVHPGEVGAISRLGNIQAHLYQEWLHLKIPIVDRSIIVDTKTKKLEVLASSASRDLQDVRIDVVMNYNITPWYAIPMLNTVGTERMLEALVITPLVVEAIKASSAVFTAEELITKRAELRDTIALNIREKLDNEGIFISAINISNIQFSASFNEAIEAKVTAEQEALRARNERDRVQYEAEQTIIKAEAEAERIRIQAEAVSQQWGKDYVQMLWIEKWNGVLPTHMLGDTTMMYMLP